MQSEPATGSGYSPKFLAFALVVIGGATLAGLWQSGRLDPFFNASKTAAGSVQAAVSHTAPPAQVPLPKAGTFVVTSISLGQPSFAIINGISRVEGQPVEAPGVTGWKVARILDGVVYLRNGATVAPVPVTLPGIKPLNDQLHPLN